MTKFSVASQSLIESLPGFLDTSGPTGFSYLLSNLKHGYVLEFEGELRRAFLDFERIWKHRLSVLGSDDAMAQVALHSMAANLWKAGRPEEADEHSKQSLRTRQRVFGSTSIITIDTTILRIVICERLGRSAKQMSLLSASLAQEFWTTSLSVFVKLIIYEPFFRSMRASLNHLEQRCNHYLIERLR